MKVGEAPSTARKATACSSHSHGKQDSHQHLKGLPSGEEGWDRRMEKVMKTKKGKHTKAVKCASWGEGWRGRSTQALSARRIVEDADMFSPPPSQGNL